MLPNTVSTTISARLFVNPVTAATSLMSAAFVKLPPVTGAPVAAKGAGVVNR